jgi:hypothetical protein
LIARALVAIGDVKNEQKKVDEADNLYHRAQVIIGSLYSDNHPCIINFNANLIEAFSQSEDESKKAETIRIAEKNLEIARKYYGVDNIFTLRYELAMASNYISQNHGQ